MPRHRKVPTRSEQMIEAAMRGDVDGIFKAADRCPLPGGDDEEAMKALRVALEKLADDPQRLVEELFSRIIQSQALLMFRCERYIDRNIADSDKRYPGMGDIPKPIADEWLPRLALLQRAVQDSAKCLATVRHTFALAQSGPIKSRVSSPNVIHFAFERSRAAASE